jgi:hypothetical protein
MRNKRYILSCIIILLTVVFYFTGEAQQRNITHRTKFSGEWQSKEPISIGGNIFCSYVEGDRMNSKTMKIVEEPNFLTIENFSSSTDKTYTVRREKLFFDGKESQINNGEGNEKKFTVKLSDDGITMTIKSTVYFLSGTPYQINIKSEAFTNVTEVWNLSNDGKSITIQSVAKSNIWGGERSWKTVFDKTN